MQPQVQTKFHISIFPGGAGWNKQNPAQIYFTSATVKEKYVDKERKFCSGEMARFSGAISKKERDETRCAYLKRRAFFAAQQGYGPSMRDNGMWFYRPPVDKITA